MSTWSITLTGPIDQSRIDSAVEAIKSAINAKLTIEYKEVDLPTEASDRYKRAQDLLQEAAGVLEGVRDDLESLKDDYPNCEKAEDAYTAASGLCDDLEDIIGRDIDFPTDAELEESEEDHYDDEEDDEEDDEGPINPARRQSPGLLISGATGNVQSRSRVRPFVAHGFSSGRAIRRR